MNGKRRKARRWKSISFVLPIVGIVLATATFTTPKTLVGQIDNECAADAIARHAECIEKRRTWLGERICDATLAARLLLCLVDTL